MNCHLPLAGFGQEDAEEIPVIGRIFNPDVALIIKVAAGVLDQHDERINTGLSIVIEHSSHLRQGFSLLWTKHAWMHPDSADPGVLVLSPG